MDIVFTNQDKVMSLIRRLENADFAPSSLGDDRGKNRDRHRPILRPSVQEQSSTHRQSAHEPVTGQGSGTNLDDPEDFLQPSASSTSTADTRTRLREMTEWKRVRLASRGNPEQVQTDSSSDSSSSNEDENENLSSWTRSPPRKRPHMDFHQEVAEAVHHCIPEVFFIFCLVSLT